MSNYANLARHYGLISAEFCIILCIIRKPNSKCFLKEAVTVFHNAAIMDILQCTVWREILAGSKFISHKENPIVSNLQK